jgi:hypothetical protein
MEMVTILSPKVESSALTNLVEAGQNPHRCPVNSSTNTFLSGLLIGEKEGAGPYTSSLYRNFTFE